MRWIVLFLAGLLLPANVVAQGRRPVPERQDRVEPPARKPMAFRIVTNDPDAPPERQLRWVTATGHITPDTPKAFDWFLKGNDIAGLTIYFDSVGGSIVGGIQLGDALRKANARVAIGRSTPLGPAPKADDKGLPRHQLLPARGICYSSCAYAFLGGRTRLIAPNAGYGLHMFWPGDQMEGILSRSYAYSEIERAQRISANLAAYFQRVDANAILLQIAAATPPKGQIRRLSPREILQYRVAEIYLGPPVLAGPGRWGLALEDKRARMTGDGESRTDKGTDIVYSLDIACPADPGFVDVQFEMAPKAGEKRTGTVRLRRAVLVAGDKSGVLARSGKDIVAQPPRFDRQSSDSPHNWISTAGTIMADVIQEAATGARSRFAVRIDDGNATFEAPFETGNLRQIYRDWTRACERIARGASTVP